MRLTKRGWNNVLIFATLFMIVLFNSTHQKFVAGDEDSEKLPLVSADAIIQVVDYSGIKFERIGSNWRIQSAIETEQNAEPEQMVNFWQTLMFETLPNVPDLSVDSYSLPVLVQAIGLDSQQVFIIHIEPTSGLVYFHNKVSDLWWLGSVNELQQLVPAILLKEAK